LIESVVNIFLALQKHCDPDLDASLEHELNQVGDVVKELESLASDNVASSVKNFKKVFYQLLGRLLTPKGIVLILCMKNCVHFMELLYISLWPH